MNPYGSVDKACVLDHHLIFGGYFQYPDYPFEVLEVLSYKDKKNVLVESAGLYADQSFVLSIQAIL